MKLIFGTAIAIASLGASGFAFAGYDSGYDPSQFERFGPTGHEKVSGPWGCRDCGFSNGTQLTGIAVEDAAVIGMFDGIRLDSVRATVARHEKAAAVTQLPIDTVILPSGEILDLR